MSDQRLAQRMVGFTRALRAEGLRLTPETSINALLALEHIDISNGADVYAALRSLTVVRPEQLAIFDRVFREYFTGRIPDEAPEAGEPEPLSVDQWAIRSPSASLSAVDDPDDELPDQRGASAIERIGRRDFSDLDDEEIERARQLIARMVWQPSDARSRRWKTDARGLRPDMRATLRSMTGPTADLVPMVMSRRRFRRRPLVVIADVSGSMEAYAEMMLTFAHAARARISRVESFVFSTRLTRVTWQLGRREVKAALAGVAAAVDDWSGGTKIGEALEAFNRDWSRRVLRGGPVVLIVSDGWDCGEPGLLDREMARLRRSVHRVVWLNPLAGRDGYAPETRGMKTVLPYIDDFLPAATLADLAEVVELLESTTRQIRVA